MESRMNHPAIIVANAMSALQSVGAAIAATGLPPALVELANLRASQINGCAVCLEGAVRDARKAGEIDDRLFLVSAGREAPTMFSDAERAALALTEAVTRLSDRTDPVSNEIWADAASHFDETQLAALVLQIANINLWNRLNVATRQYAGVHTW